MIPGLLQGIRRLYSTGSLPTWIRNRGVASTREKRIRRMKECREIEQDIASILYAHHPPPPKPSPASSYVEPPHRPPYKHTTASVPPWAHSSVQPPPSDRYETTEEAEDRYYPEDKGLSDEEEDSHKNQKDDSDLPRWTAGQSSSKTVAEHWFDFQRSRENRMRSRFGPRSSAKSDRSTFDWSAAWEDAEAKMGENSSGNSSNSRRFRGKTTTFHRYYFFTDHHQGASGRNRSESESGQDGQAEGPERRREDLRLLGITESESQPVSAEQIKRAFHRQALLSHPDRQPRASAKEAAEKFRLIREAYSRLTK